MNIARQLVEIVDGIEEDFTAEKLHQRVPHIDLPQLRKRLLGMKKRGRIELVHKTCAPGVRVPVNVYRRAPRLGPCGGVITRHLQPLLCGAAV